MERQEILQLSYNILLLIFICVLIVTIGILIKTKDLINQDAITYGMNQNNFSNCLCNDYNGKSYIFSRDNLSLGG